MGGTTDGCRQWLVARLRMAKTLGLERMNKHMRVEVGCGWVGSWVRGGAQPLAPPAVCVSGGLVHQVAKDGTRLGGGHLDVGADGLRGRREGEGSVLSWGWGGVEWGGWWAVGGPSPQVQARRVLAERSRPASCGASITCQPGAQHGQRSAKTTAGGLPSLATAGSPAPAARPGPVCRPAGAPPA